MRVGLIASGAYIKESLAVEFGRLPPSFLPLGGQRLFCKQIECLSTQVEKIYLSIPEDYSLKHRDCQLLDTLGVGVVKTPATLSIGQSLLNCLVQIGDFDSGLVVLYGDTFIQDFGSIPENMISVHEPRGDYNWADLVDLFPENENASTSLSISGLFSFSDITFLMNAVITCAGDFLEALRIYDQKIPLRFLRQGIWKDFGHLQNYFNSAAMITTERNFNHLLIEDGRAWKGSNDKSKILAEALWYEQIPSHLRVYTPTYLGRETKNGLSGYGTEHTYLSTLSHLLVFGDIGEQVWLQILSSCKSMLEDYSKILPDSGLEVRLNDYFNSKTKRRLKRFFETDVGQDAAVLTSVNNKNVPSVDTIVSVANEIIDSIGFQAPTLVHGDFCFSNIFFDFRRSQIKVIDPRGLLPNGDQSIYGCSQYDVAKLSHSVFGGYDFIMTEYKTGHLSGKNLIIDGDLETTGSLAACISAGWKSGVFDQFSREQILATNIHLFLSMLPLHEGHPKRQLAMLGTAFESFLSLKA